VRFLQPAHRSERNEGDPCGHARRLGDCRAKRTCTEAATKGGRPLRSADGPCVAKLQITLGELTASIAHEVNRPLTSVVANAEACLRWLDRETPDLDAARRSVEQIISGTIRAAGSVCDLNLHPETQAEKAGSNKF
jgi:C4-dicarboxylate-specific signal transduction histidine kinase